MKAHEVITLVITNLLKISISISQEVIPSNYPDLIDLLKMLLTIGPKDQISCSEALDHAFFKQDLGEQEPKKV